MSNEEYTHQDFWKQRTWIERMEQRMLNKYLEDLETLVFKPTIKDVEEPNYRYLKNPRQEDCLNHLFWFDAKGRKIIGTSADRTCLTCFTGFSLNTMTKDGASPCCGTFNHAAVLWE